MAIKGKVLRVCALCHQLRTLCQSHIIPEFLYKQTYDKKHRALMLRSDVFKQILLQQGIREDLLCFDCEQLLNDRYEKPFLKMWFDASAMPQVIKDELVEITGLDYAAFKLFHLSILWRASVAAQPAFANARLGSKHCEALRTMLLNCDPGPRARYGILGALLLKPGTLDICHSIILGPTPRRMEGHRTYLMIYGGCAWYVVVSGHRQPELLDSTLTAAGELRLTHYEFTKFQPLIDIGRDRRLAQEKQSRTRASRKPGP